MAADRELPGWFDAVHPVHAVPYRAEAAVGVVVVALVTRTDQRGAIGFSSFCVLTYYAIANASAWTLPPEQRRCPRPVRSSASRAASRFSVRPCSRRPAARPDQAR